MVGEGAAVGSSPENASDRDDWGVAVIGHRLSIAGGKTVAAKAMIKENVV